MDWLIIGGLLAIIILQLLFRPKKDTSDTQNELKRLLDEMQRSFERIEKNFREDFRLNREEGRIVARDNREELTRSMSEFREAFDRGIASFNNLQREKFANLDEQQRLLVANTEKRLEDIRQIARGLPLLIADLRVLPDRLFNLDDQTFVFFYTGKNAFDSFVTGLFHRASFPAQLFL